MTIEKLNEKNLSPESVRKIKVLKKIAKEAHRLQREQEAYYREYPNVLPRIACFWKLPRFPVIQLVTNCHRLNVNKKTSHRYSIGWRVTTCNPMCACAKECLGTNLTAVPPTAAMISYSCWHALQTKIVMPTSRRWTSLLVKTRQPLRVHGALWLDHPCQRRIMATPSSARLGSHGWHCTDRQTGVGPRSGAYGRRAGLVLLFHPTPCTHAHNPCTDTSVWLSSHFLLFMVSPTGARWPPHPHEWTNPHAMPDSSSQEGLPQSLQDRGDLLEIGSFHMKHTSAKNDPCVTEARTRRGTPTSNQYMLCLLSYHRERALVVTPSPHANHSHKGQEWLLFDWVYHIDNWN